jgi:hypothetical protein
MASHLPRADIKKWSNEWELRQQSEVLQTQACDHSLANSVMKGSNNREEAAVMESNGKERLIVLQIVKS